MLPPRPPRNTQQMVPKPLKSLKVSVHQDNRQILQLLEASLPTSNKSFDVINNTTPVGKNSDVDHDDDKVNPEDSNEDDDKENDDEENPDNSNSNLNDSGRKSKSNNNNEDSVVDHLLSHIIHETSHEGFEKV